MYFQSSPDIVLYPNSLSNPSISQRNLNNPQTQQSPRRKKLKNNRKNKMMNGQPKTSTEMQLLMTLGVVSQPRVQKSQRQNRPKQKQVKDLSTKIQTETFKENQTLTNYSDKESISNQRERSFSEDEQVQKIFKRKKRKSCFERQNYLMPNLYGSQNEARQKGTVEEQLILPASQTIAYECNERERESGSTQPVGESNTDLVRSFDQRKSINGQQDLGNLLNPGVQQHPVQFSETQHQQEATIENATPYIKSDIVIPQRTVEDFITDDIFIQVQLHEFQNDGFIREINKSFSRKYERYYPRNTSDSRIKQTVNFQRIQGFKIISINCGMNINTPGRNKKERNWLFTSKEQAMAQMIKVVISFMEAGYDYILLQQAYDTVFKLLLAEAIKKFNRRQIPELLYVYPQHLEKNEDIYTTTILTKHQVKMGQLQFNFVQMQGKSKLPLQAFCEFKIKINGVQQDACIFNCHLKSCRGSNKAWSGMIRKSQINAITQFSKKFKRFFCIGDTNIPSHEYFAQENIYVNSLFFDAINYENSQVRGTFLFRNYQGKVVPQRVDRVLLNKESALTTSVTIDYRDELLDNCWGKGLDQIKVLENADRDEFPYIYLTDHTMLDIEIMCTRR